jgi:protein TonB
LKCTYRSIGFVTSALVHLVGVAALLPQLGDAARSAEAESRVAVSLAMFQPVAPPAPVEPEPGSQPETPVEPRRAEPEPASVQPVPEVLPEPLPEPTRVKPVAIEPVPEPRPVARPKSRPESKPGPRRIAKPTVQPPKMQPDIRAAVRPSTVAPQPSPVSVNRSVGEPSAPAASSVKDRYLQALVERIHQKKYYPRKARRRREEGTVLVAFVIDRSGRLSDIRVTRSSGHDSLDKAAIKTLKKISPFRELPPELGVGHWELAVPIAFELRP